MSRHNRVGMSAVLLMVFMTLSGCGDGGPTGVSDTWDWPEGPPASQGLNKNLLDSLSALLSTGDLGPVPSILIVRNGVLVYEEYFRGKGPDDLHGLQSVTKSVASALIGIARDRGLIGDLQTPVLDFFPEYAEVENDDDWKRAMTLEHLLQMRTGIEWDEWDSEDETWSEQATLFWNSPDWIKSMLDQPMASAPGSEWRYNTGASTILSGILKNTVGTSASTFARNALFGPMGIEPIIWWESPTGLTSTGTGLDLRPRDMAKFGYLFLEQGLWRPTNERLISQEWVDASFQRYTQFGDGGYGYQWWVCVSGYDGRNVQIPFAKGYGGQYIFVIDPLDMVIVVTGEHYQGEPQHINQILYDFLLPAADPEYGWPISGETMQREKQWLSTPGTPGQGGPGRGVGTTYPSLPKLPVRPGT